MNNTPGKEDIFTKIAGRLSNIVLLGFCALVFSLPIVTISASITSLNVAMSSYLQFDDPKPLKTFLKAFKEKWKLCTKVWVIELALAAVFVWDFVYYRTGNKTLDILGQTGIAVLSFILVFATIGSFIVMAEDMADTVVDVLKKSVDLMFNRFFTALCIVILAITPMVVAFIIMPGLILFFPGIQAYLCYHLIPKMLKEYKFKRGNALYSREQRNK